MVVRMRHTRAHTGNRRSHHALKKTQLTQSKDGTKHPRHRALLDGTLYRGRSVMDKVSARLERRRKALKQREKDSGPAKEKAEEPKKETKKVVKAEAKPKKVVKKKTEKE